MGLQTLTYLIVGATFALYVAIAFAAKARKVRSAASAAGVG